MKQKEIEAIIKPPTPHFVGDGFRVHNFIPGDYRLSMYRMNPFIMLDYNSKHYFSPAEKQRGVDVHPHRGFETVTIAYKGKVAHHDSRGNSGIIGEGDVQWMTAASGILHKEYHEKEYSRNGGDFQMVQLWVNLPADKKMSEPKYQDILNKDIPKFLLNNNGGMIEVIAGQYKNIIGTADTFTPVHLYNAKLNAGAEADFEFPEEYNTAVLVIEGEIQINQTANLQTDHLALFKNNGEAFTINAQNNAVVLILSGLPINEPIAAHGPFVMNSKEELVTAFQDFENGKFGVLQ